MTDIDVDIETHDYAIIGGGVAGAYAFWRLAKLGQDVVLYEASDRIGGRLYSVTPPNMPNLRAELGGMRFLNSQDFVVALASQLGLQTSAFPMGGANNLAYLRSHLLRDSQFSDPAAVPYFLANNEKGLNPGEILVNAIKTVVPNALKYTPQEWEIEKQTLRWKSDHIYNWGFWDAIFSTMSSEAYALLMDAGGYESLTDNWNAAEACEHLLADFPSNVSYMRLPGGYQLLPEALVEQSGSTNVKTGWKLEAIVGGSQFPVLNFKIPSIGPPQYQAVMAKNVILAMPQMPIQKIVESSNVFQYKGGIAKKLDSVTPMPAVKILMGFPNAWWEKLNVTAGRSTTDLPLRQVYYFGTDPSTGHALLMAAYSDGRAESFWRYLIDTAIETKTLVAEVLTGTALQSEVLRQLSIMHGGIQIPNPTWMKLVDWTLPPYGAGWHFWNSGIDVGDTIAGIRQPQAGLPVYICGESFSNEQGWVEGALNSAELVLRSAWNTIPIPNWLQRIYLGP